MDELSCFIKMLQNSKANPAVSRKGQDTLLLSQNVLTPLCFAFVWLKHFYLITFLPLCM